MLTRLVQRQSRLFPVSVRHFAIEDRSNKIECSAHFSEINCSDTYTEWEEFENFRKLYPFPKYTAQAQSYKKRHIQKKNLKEVQKKYAKSQQIKEQTQMKNQELL